MEVTFDLSMENICWISTGMISAGKGNENMLRTDSMGMVPNMTLQK